MTHEEEERKHCEAVAGREWFGMDEVRLADLIALQRADAMQKVLVQAANLVGTPAASKAILKLAEQVGPKDGGIIISAHLNAGPKGGGVIIADEKPQAGSPKDGGVIVMDPKDGGK